MVSQLTASAENKEQKQKAGDLQKRKSGKK